MGVGADFLVVPLLLVFHFYWLVPVKQATGVPTRTVEEPHRPSRVLAELSVVAIADFLSEFEQLERS
jgi:hypothetical protein